ncbi:MAG: hypothetical protein WCO00_10060 [Rhodospirillaceae bacterium]
MSSDYHETSIQLAISRRIRDLSERLTELGDGKYAAEALRLADAVAFLEAEIARHRTAHVCDRSRRVRDTERPERPPAMAARPLPDRRRAGTPPLMVVPPPRPIEYAVWTAP